jgi:hypothetical protein
LAQTPTHTPLHAATAPHSFSKFVNNTATDGLIQAEHSRGGFASTSFVGNTVTAADGAVVALTDGSLFLGRNALFRDNVGGDLLAQDSHFRIDKSVFQGSALNLDDLLLDLDDALPLLGEDAAEEEEEEDDHGQDTTEEEDEEAAEDEEAEDEQEEPAAPIEEDEEAVAAPVAIDSGDEAPELTASETDTETRARRRLQDAAEQEGSVARLIGASSLRGFNNFIDGTQGPAILALDASNVTLGRPCFTNDAAGAGSDARFVEAAALEGNLTLWGACAFPTDDVRE